MDREFNSEQKMRADAIEKGLAGGFEKNYDAIGILAVLILGLIIAVVLASKKKKV